MEAWSPCKILEHR
uniref:Uncharacterized protein n=1 Tax=Arundo donax TaxID=35708 RepID=A0A0A9FRK4_ARUDO